MKKAVCLLSGGLDSATALYQAKKDGYEVYALTMEYGQSHIKETEYARKLAAKAQVAGHYVTRIDLPWGGSALLDSSIPIPKKRQESDMAKDIPVTYVPARNTIFLSFAGSYAETCGAEAIFIGANELDYSGYPDCRPEYLEAFTKALALGTKCGVEGKSIKIETPLLRLSKKEIILLGKKIGVPYELTWSCYQGGAMICGECDSCKLRAKGFQEAGLTDPLTQNAKSTHSH